jgi:dipeptidyl aminopeptidase/acylaminoacyl peptidase
MPPQPPKTCGLAIASLVLGLVSCGVTGVVGVVLGHLAMKSIKRSGGALTGGGLAIAGLILGYAEKGIAVVLYSLDGNAPEDGASTAETSTAYEAFRAAKGGLANAKNALEFVLARMPKVAPSRIYAAGHSSAGTVALLFAAHEPRLAGCLAYAPVADVEAHHQDLSANPFAGIAFPGVKLFIRQSSPMTHAGRFTKPILLFHAADDDRVSSEDITKFTNAVKAKGGSVKLEEVPTGGHYDSMIDLGIPAGIRFIDP